MNRQGKIIAMASVLGLIAWLVGKRNNSFTGMPPKVLARGISQAGVDFLKKEEGLRLDKYLDSAGHETIGYGHKIVPPEFFPMRITEATAETLLRRDLQRFESAIHSLVKVPITQNMYDALVSWAYNVGEGEEGAAGSTLIKKLNKRDYQGAADELLRWKFAGGEPILLERRKRERKVFLA